MPNNIHAGHRKNVRKKFLQSGFTPSTPPHEVLELLLYYAVPRKDTNPIAHELINKFKTLSAVFEADIEELVKVKGISESSAILIKLIPAVLDACYFEQVHSPKHKVGKEEKLMNYILSQYYGKSDEMVGVASLDSGGKMQGFDVVASGTPGKVELDFQKIAGAAVKRGAHSIILVHNHPNGMPLPSRQDADATIYIKNNLETLGIALKDHIIISGEDYISFAESSRFKESFKNVQ